MLGTVGFSGTNPVQGKQVLSARERSPWLAAESLPEVSPASSKGAPESRGASWKKSFFSMAHSGACYFHTSTSQKGLSQQEWQQPQSWAGVQSPGSKRGFSLYFHTLVWRWIWARRERWSKTSDQTPLPSMPPELQVCRPVLVGEGLNRRRAWSSQGQRRHFLKKQQH